jgi:hypothetical protein
MNANDIKYSARMVVGRATCVTPGLVQKRGELFQMDTECSDADRARFEAEVEAHARYVHKFCDSL